MTRNTQSTFSASLFIALGLAVSICGCSTPQSRSLGGLLGSWQEPAAQLQVTETTPTQNQTRPNALPAQQPQSPVAHNPRQQTQPINQSIALVSHQEVANDSTQATEVLAPTYSPDEYPGVYERAGFRSRLSFGMDEACGGPNCGQPAGCACGTSVPCNPIICQFPGDPNEYLCDGGDQMPDARVKLNNDVAGLGIEDTIVHYETGDGLTYVEPSNRVCVYAPRFAAVRKVTAAVTGEKVQGTQRVDLPHGPVGIDRRQPSSAVMAPLGPERNVVALGPEAMRDRNRGVPAENVLQPLLTADVSRVLSNLSIIEQGILRESDKPWLAKGALAAIDWTSEEGAQVMIDEEIVGITINDQKPEELRVIDFGKGRVRLIKLADRRNALPGEYVHFVLRFDNVGDQAVNNVAILDNLTTRLEYVEGSQTCTKGAKFSTQANEGESLRLRWELTESLDIGEGCVIRFKCRVR